MNIKQEKKRSDAIDMIKGLAIMTLFFMHFENGWLKFDYDIFLIRSSAFYMVVGWLWGQSSKRRSVKEHWNKRLDGLIKPYIYFSAIFLFFDIIKLLCQIEEPFILYRDIYKTLCLRGIGTLWFLPSLLGGEIAFLYFRDKKRCIKHILMILIIILLLLIWNGINIKKISEIINAPITVIKNMIIAFILINISYYISKRWGKDILALKKTSLFLLGIILLLLDFILVNINSLNGAIFYIFQSTIAWLGILLLFTGIEHFKIISKPLVYCGKNSLIIMAVHFGILFEIAKITDKYIMGNEFYYGERTIIYFLVALILQIFIIEFINKKVPFIIGK